MFFRKYIFLLYLILLFPLVTNANQFKESAIKLGITLSGHFIDDTLINKMGNMFYLAIHGLKKILTKTKEFFTNLDRLLVTGTEIIN